MLVDESVHSFWKEKYDSLNEIKRFGIEDENGDTVVELYLRKINILPFPNKTLFKLYKNQVETQPIFISKAATMKDLKTKINRVLNNYLFFVQRRKDVLISNVRIWRLNSDQGLAELDSKYINYTKTKIDATVLNLTEEQNKKQMHEVDISDNDVVIIELEKDKSFVFQPLKEQESEEHKHEDF
jgi:hypothetical protein